MAFTELPFTAYIVPVEDLLVAQLVSCYLKQTMALMTVYIMTRIIARQDASNKKMISLNYNQSGVNPWE